MKFIILFLIVMFDMAKVHGQIIADTSLCEGSKRKGHLEFLIDRFKNECLDQTTQYNYVNVAFSNKKTILFLNKNFKTHIFNRVCFLEKSSSRIILADGNDYLVFGMVEVGFGSNKELDRAIKIIKSGHLNVFQIEVATPFVLLKEEDTLILVFAEIKVANRAVVDCFLDKLKAIKGQYVRIK